MRIFIYITFIFIASYCQAQKLYVVEAKKAYIQDKKISIGDSLEYSSNPLIKAKGRLILKGRSSIPLRLESGSFNLKNEYQKHLNRYQHHDSIYNYLDSLGVADCSHFKYELTHYNSLNAVYEKGHIEIFQDSSVYEKYGTDYFASINPKEDSIINIKWTNPDKDYQGKYYLLVISLFEDYVHLIETEKTYYNFPLKVLENPNFSLLLFFKVISENCRESYKMAVHFEPE